MESFSTAFITNYPSTLALLKVVGPPFVALIVAFVASIIQYNQWRTARDKVRLDLFEQRLDIYNELFFYLNEKVLKSEVTQDEFRALEKAMNAAQFLFPNDVYNYLNRLKNLIDAHRCAFVQWKVGERDNKSVSEEQRRIGSELQEIGEKFDAEWSTARIVFAPYLSFGHIRK
jgi:hypothetical protein